MSPRKRSLETELSISSCSRRALCALHPLTRSQGDEETPGEDGCALRVPRRVPARTESLVKGSARLSLLEHRLPS